MFSRRPLRPKPVRNMFMNDWWRTCLCSDARAFRLDFPERNFEFALLVYAFGLSYLYFALRCSEGLLTVAVRLQCVFTISGFPYSFRNSSVPWRRKMYRAFSMIDCYYHVQLYVRCTVQRVQTVFVVSDDDGLLSCTQLQQFGMHFFRVYAGERDMKHFTVGCFIVLYLHFCYFELLKWNRWEG